MSVYPRYILIKGAQELIQHVSVCIPDLIGIWQCWFFWRGENQNTWRKTSWSKETTNSNTQPTYDAGTRNPTWVTLVGDEFSHHCATPAPQCPRWHELLLVLYATAVICSQNEVNLHVPIGTVHDFSSECFFQILSF